MSLPKERSKSKATEIREKKRSSENNDYEYVLLSEALNKVAEVSDEEDVEITYYLLQILMMEIQMQKLGMTKSWESR